MLSFHLSRFSQTKVRYFPKSTFNIKRARAGNRRIIKKNSKTVDLKTCMLWALTCTTACNAKCKAIQSTLKIPTCFKWFVDFKSQAAKNLQI